MSLKLTLRNSGIKRTLLFSAEDNNKPELRQYVRRKSWEWTACGGTKLKLKKGHLIVLEGEAEHPLIKLNTCIGKRLIEFSIRSESSNDNKDTDLQDASRNTNSTQSNNQAKLKKTKNPSPSKFYLKSVLQTSRAVVKLKRLILWV